MSHELEQKPGNENSVPLHKVLAHGLAGHDVEVVFGVLGDGNLFIMDSFRRYNGGRYVSLSHEASAVMAASGYSQVTGKLGVATVTQGPGLTHTITALVDAARARQPLLVIAGDIPPMLKGHVQRISQAEVVQPTGAGFELVRGPNTALADLEFAVRRALLERRPIVLSVSATSQWEPAEQRPVIRRYVTPQAVQPDPTALDAPAGIIATARRPVVLAGHGVAGGASAAAVLRLAKRIGAPTATTLLGSGLFADYEYNLGVCGTFSHEVALEALMASDCIISFGASLNIFTTAEGSLLRGKRIVQVDVDPAAIGRMAPVTAGIVGDAGAVADIIVRLLDEAEIESSGFCSEDLAQKLRDRARAAARSHDPTRALDIPGTLERVNRIFPQKRTVVFDGGRFFLVAIPMVDVREPNAYVHTNSFCSIGLGMGHAIGAALARPDRPVLLVTGDGGFMNGGITEFVTAVRHKLNVTVVVLNDAAYGTEVLKMKEYNLDPELVTFEWPDLGRVATAMGGRGFSPRNIAELDQAMAEATSPGPPTLIDVKIDRDAVPYNGPTHAPRALD